MCEVSDKLKLCSCKTEDVEKLKHYWILQRPFQGDISVVGTIMAPADCGTLLEEINPDRIETQLNENSCFDADINYKENDILYLYFTCNKPSLEIPDPSGYLAYAFQFKNSKAGMIRKPFK